MRLNRPIVGFIIGVLAPVLGFFIVFALRRAGASFDAFIAQMKSYPPIAAANVTLALLANGLIFTYFSNRRLDYTARGIFYATLLYVIFILYLRFVA